MDLQSTFYTISIVLMLFILAFFITISFMLWRAYKALNEIREKFVEKPLSYINTAKDKSAAIVGTAAILVSSLIGNRLRRALRR